MGNGRLLPLIALSTVVAFAAQVWKLAGSRMMIAPSDRLGLPIFILGLPRSGSIAFHDYFTCRGIESSHYCCKASETNEIESGGGGALLPTRFPCQVPSTEKSSQIGTCGDCVLQNMQRRRPPLQGCGNYQVWSQFDVEAAKPFAYFLPQHFALSLLHEAYPNATWVLNTRPPEAWAASVQRWRSITRRMQNSFDIRVPDDTVPKTATREELVESMQHNLDAHVNNATERARRRNELEEVYRNHTDLVRTWAAQYPEHNLVEAHLDGSNDDDITQVLEQIMIKSGLIPPDSEPSKCKFHFDPVQYDSDWKNYKLPFEFTEKGKEVA